MMQTIAQFGYGVWMFIVMCLASVLYAALFAVRGGMHRFRLLCALSAGLVFATGGAVCMGVATAAASAARLLARDEPKVARQLIGGLGEAFAAGLMGFGCLTLVALLVVTAIARGLLRPER